MDGPRSSTEYRDVRRRRRAYPGGGGALDVSRQKLPRSTNHQTRNEPTGETAPLVNKGGAPVGAGDKKNRDTPFSDVAASPHTHGGFRRLAVRAQWRVGSCAAVAFVDLRSGPRPLRGRRVVSGVRPCTQSTNVGHPWPTHACPGGVGAWRLPVPTSVGRGLMPLSLGPGLGRPTSFGPRPGCPARSGRGP